MSGNYTEKQQWALEQFDALVNRLGSQNKACNKVGIAAAIMTPLKKGTYQGNSDAQFDKLVSYFEAKTEAAAAPSRQVVINEYAPTSVSTQVYEVIRNCQLQGGLAVACGSAGIGKTMAAKQYVREHPNEAVYIAANPCFRNLKALLKLLCNKMGVTERTIDEMWLGLTNKLRDGMVIIIDEAQHLTIKVLEALRALSDDFDDSGRTLGLCFIGNTETVTVMGGKKRAEFAQISNRTKQRKVYTTNSIKKSDIQLLFPSVQTEMEVDFLLHIARSPQAIRGAVNLYANAADNGNTTYEGLVAMAKHMELAV